MKLKFFLIALLASLVLATITPPLFTTTPVAGQQTALQSSPNADSLIHSKDSGVVLPADERPPVINPDGIAPADPAGLWGLGIERILGIIAAIITLLYMFIPNVKKDRWYMWLPDLIALVIPNFKAGGGTHQLNIFYALYTYFFARKRV